MRVDIEIVKQNKSFVIRLAMNKKSDNMMQYHVLLVVLKHICIE